MNHQELRDDAIGAVLQVYGVTVTLHLCEKIRQYIDLLLRWNRRVSLTTIAEPDEMLRFHFGESFFAADAVPIQNGRLADYGSGAGFPGIPLALVEPALEVVLIESNAKKLAFLAEVRRSLDIQNIQIFHGRAADLPMEEPHFDFVAARAVGQFSELLAWSTSRLAPRGRLILWLGETDARVFTGHGDWIWQSPIKIPRSARRVLLIGQKGEV